MNAGRKRKVAIFETKGAVLSSTQLGMAAIIILFGLVLAAFSHLAKERRASISVILICGIGCALFGLAAACLTEHDCFEVFLLKDTAGFGRTYVVGLAITVAAPFTLLLRVITRKQD